MPEHSFSFSLSMVKYLLKIVGKHGVGTVPYILNGELVFLSSQICGSKINIL